MRIGFIGLGIMGAPMAQNLIKAGYDLVVYNRTSEKCTPLRQAGAEVADSPCTVAEKTDIIITIVSDTPDVEHILFGADGAYEGISQGKVVIDMSTISPAESVNFSKRLAEKKAQMLDAPVSGGQNGAIEGTLSIMVGGGDSTFERCRPILEAMGKTIIHIGPNGHGLMTKMVNQLAGSITLCAMAEAVRLIVESGLDAYKALRAVCGGSARSGMLEKYPQRVLAGDFDPGFKIKLMNKDLRLASETLESLGLNLPTFQKAFQLFKESEESGLGELGVQGVYKYLQEKI